MQKKLYRDTDNKLIAGVCSGFADYFEMDVTLVRLLFILVPALNVLVYIILAIIMPVKNDYNAL